MKLPCIDCITFAICKDTVPMRHSGTALGSHIEGVLMKKCILIHDFVYFNNNEKSSGENMMKVKEYFNKKMKR